MLKSERAVVEEWIRLEFSLASGFQLPEELCERCLHELFSYCSELESLQQLLALGPHPCLYTLSAITLLDAALHSDLESIARLGEVIGTEGWNHGPADC